MEKIVKTGLALAVGLVSGLALAAKGDVQSAPLVATDSNPNAVGGIASTPNSLVVLKLGGAESWDAFGDPPNQIATCITGGSVTGIGWDDVGITTVGVSWLSEARIMFGTPTVPAQISLAPSGTSAPGSESGLTSGGIIDLTDITLPDIPLGSDPLRLEFFEGFDDVPNAIDANWDSGLLSIAGIDLEVAVGPDCTLGIFSPKPVPSLSWTGLGGLLLGMMGLAWYARRRMAVA